jgi:hypothetical protein
MRIIVRAGFVVVSFAATAFAQSPCSRTAPLTDQEQFVRSEIQSRIDESIEAAEANDFAARVRYLAPDLSIKLLDGTVLDRQQLEQGMKRDADWILSVSDQTSIRIECFELKGKEALLITDQHFVRTVPDRKDGSPHQLITNVTHRETWVYTKEGWLTERIEELQQGPTFLDGKRYNE